MPFGEAIQQSMITHSHITQSILAVQIGVKVPAKIARRVVETQLLIDPVQIVQILLFELEVPGQIALDALGRLALGQHAVALGNAPRQRDLRAVLAVFLADLDDGGVLD